MQVEDRQIRSCDECRFRSMDSDYNGHCDVGLINFRLRENSSEKYLQDWRDRACKRYPCDMNYTLDELLELISDLQYNSYLSNSSSEESQ